MTDSPGSIFSPASPEAQAITNLFVITLWICAAIFAVVLGLIGYSLAKYRWREGDADPEQIDGNKRLELIWTAIPVAIVALLFALTLRAMSHADPAPPPGEPDLVVVGHQWWWEIRSPKLGYVAANEIHIPVGRPMSVRLDTVDVLHEFWVPRLGRKMTTVPLANNHLWLRADQEGVYEGDCTEYCGTQHAWMRFQVIVESQAKYDAWVHQQQQRAVVATTPAAERGRETFKALTCINCHRSDGGGGTSNAGPDLTHIAGRRYLASRLLPYSADNLRKWLADPQAIKEGTLMPNFKLSDQQLDELVAYLTTLQ